jgi:Polysaccharide lyase
MPHVSKPLLLLSTLFIFITSAASIILLPSPVQAQVSVNYDFEDGVMRGNPTSMKVPPKILEDNGYKFMRITGSTGDCEAIPGDLCPPRNRSTVVFTTGFGSMSLISDSNRRQTYSADIRFHDDTGSDGNVFSLFQDGPQTGGYGTRDGQDPVVIFWRDNGKVQGRANKANETDWDKFDLGTVHSGEWHNYMVKAVWSHDTSEGRIEIYFDGHLKMTVTGRDSNLGPTSNRIPEMKMGLYGDYATGVIDVDNIRVKPHRQRPNSHSYANLILISSANPHTLPNIQNRGPSQNHQHSQYPPLSLPLRYIAGYPARRILRHHHGRTASRRRYDTLEH